MRTHLVQLDIAWEDPGANFERVDALLGGATVGPGDLIVLPELFAVGFSLDIEVIADRDGRTAGFICRLADRFRCTVQGGRAVVGRDGKGRNLMSVAGPGCSGTPSLDYAKVHPFSFGREPEAFTGGSKVEVYPWRAPGGELCVCPVICYDLRFPELFRAGLDRGAEVYAVGANWPDARQSHWRSLLIARAIENQAFVLGVNRTGSDPHLSYAGGSIVVDPVGVVLGELGAEEGVLSIPIDPDRVHGWRVGFPAWKDRRIGVASRPDMAAGSSTD